MSTVKVNGLRVRSGPSTNSEAVAHYDAGQVIKSGNLVMQNEGRWWLRYTASSGATRYICAIDSDGSVFIDVPGHIPRQQGSVPQPTPNPSSPSGPTGMPGIPKQTSFPEHGIRNWGCCFLCACVKGGLTTYQQCLDCFYWAKNSGKIRNDCYVIVGRENLARDVSNKYGTPYHSDYCFQKGPKHFWLTRNGVEIFNSEGIGHH